jgi:hypothetical protein
MARRFRSETPGLLKISFSGNLLVNFGLWWDNDVFFCSFPTKKMHCWFSWPPKSCSRSAGERRDANEGEESLHLFHRKRRADPGPDGSGFAQDLPWEVANFGNYDLPYYHYYIIITILLYDYLFLN